MHAIEAEFCIRRIKLQRSAGIFQVGMKGAFVEYLSSFLKSQEMKEEL